MADAPEADPAVEAPSESPEPLPEPVVEAQPEPEEETLAIFKPDIVGKAWVIEEMVSRAELEGEDDNNDDGGGGGGDDDDDGAALPEMVPRKVVKAADTVDDVRARIRAAGLTIVEERRVVLSRQEAQEFYAEHKGKPFFHKLCQFMSSGPSVALRLRGVGAIAAWRALLGPTNPSTARDKYQAEVAEVQAQLSSQLERLDAIRARRAAKEEAAAAKAAERQERIDQGLPVEEEEPEEEPEEESDSDDEGKPREETEDDVLPLVDPTLVQNTIRGVHGSDGTRNACHGSDSTFSAARELDFFFGRHETRETTLAMIKPDAVSAGYAPQIVERIEAEGFFVLAHQEVTLTPARAGQFYAEHRGKPFFEPLVEFMTSGPIRVLVLERVGAIRRWRRLMGPTNNEQAKDCAPTSLRALFGSSTTFNAVHGSDSRESAEREIAFHFPEPLASQRTLAMIKPGLSPQAVYEIKRDIERHGFTVHTEATVKLSRERAELFYAEHRGRPFFPRLVEYMSSAPVVALVLAKPNAIRCWRQLAGPTNTFSAREQRPDSLRARFGSDGTRNAVHGSDSPASAARETAFFFPNVFQEQLPVRSVTQYFRSKPVGDPFDPALGEETLHTLLTRGLSELVRLSKAAPADVEGLAAVTWLGEWLLANNPRQGAVSADGELPPQVAPAAPAPKQAGVQRVQLPPQAKPFMVFVVGGPHSGATTQCAAVAAELGLEHVNVQALVAAEARAPSRAGRKLAELLEAGQPAPGKTVVGLVKRAMRRSAKRRFLLDTFPPDLQTALAFEASVGKPDFVLHLDVPDDVLFSRLKHWAREDARVNPDRPRLTAAEEAERLSRRVQRWSDGAQPVLDFYRKSGYLRTVSGVGQPAQITPAVRAALAPHVVFVVGPSGSGRTTAVRELEARLGFTPVRLSELVDRELHHHGPHAKAIRDLVEAGRDVPDGVALDLVLRALHALPSNRFALDGFPASAAQARALQAAIGAPPRVVVELQCPREACLARVKARGRRKNRWRDDGNAGLAAARHAASAAGAAEVAALYGQSLLVRAVDADAAPAAVARDVMHAAAPACVLVAGAPGVGKTTQCAKLAKRFGHTVLSPADVLRAEVARKSALGAEVQAALDARQPVPVSLTFRALAAAMAASGADSFVLDDFPRTLEQAERFADEVGAVEAVVHLDMPADAVEARLQEPDGEAVQRRCAHFADAVGPALDFFALQGAVRTVPGAGLPDAVHELVCTAVERMTVLVLGRPGAGKTALCEALAERCGFVHVQLERLLAGAGSLRAEGGEEEERGGEEEGEPEAGAGPLDSPEELAELVAAAIRRCGSARVVLDGFPRNAAEAAAFEAAWGSYALAVELALPAEAAHARALAAQPQRRGRKAANERVVAAAEAAFEEHTAPLLELMREQGHLTAVDAAQPAAAVAAAVAQRVTPSLVLLWGPPRAGKRTIAARLGREFRYQHVSVSALLHAEVAADTPDGRVIAEHLGRRTVPLELTLRLLRRAVARSTSARVLVQGFPRVVGDAPMPSFADQLAALQRDVAPVERVLLVSADEDERRARERSSAAWERDDEVYFFEKAGAVPLFEQAGKLAHVTGAGAVAYSQARMQILDSTQPRRRSFGSVGSVDLGSVAP